jgi:hypothetical protein
MERDKILSYRDFFLRAFVIGVVFALFYFVVTFAFWNTWASLTASWFNIDEKEFTRVVLQFFLHVRLVIVFFFLVPALALHWMSKRS